MKLYQRRHVISKFKTIIAVCVMAAISALCAVSAVASVSFTTDVYWNPNETKAWAETVVSGVSGRDLCATAYIQSRSTGEYKEIIKPSYNSGSTVTATTESVTVTYPTDIPPVYYGGSYWFLD